MSLLRRWAARTRARVRSAGPRTRLWAAAAVALAILGGVWTALEVGDSQPPWTAVGEGTLSAADLEAAVDLAARRGIPHRVDSGRLLVPAPEAAKLRGALTARGLLGREAADSMGALAAQANIWETSAQSARRWQAAIMSTLSREIRHFPEIRHATVLFDPGQRRGFGRPAVPATASVKVTLADRARLGAKLALAIADLVTGSVAGMDRSRVHVVDNSGRSYRFDAEGVVGSDEPAERLRQAEAYLREKVLHTLQYIDHVMVGVCVIGEGPQERCRSVSIGVPRSYLAAVYRAAHDTGQAPDDAALESFAVKRLAKVRRSVMDIVSIEDANAVRVDWYYDVPPAGAVAAGADDAHGWAPPTGRAMASVSLASLGLLAGLGAFRRRRRAHLAEAAAAASNPPATGEAPAGEEDAAAEDPFELLRQASGEELRTLLQGEHLQTITLILSHVSPTTAGEVLGAFDRDRQVEISRRIAALAAVDVDVVAEAVRGLLSRRRHDPAEGAESAGGPGKVAKILHHAGYATERAVLDGLRGTEPALAESIRKRMFVFEDLAELPRDVLKPALEPLGSDELAIALRTAGKKVKEKILSALARDATAAVRVQMERIGPVRLSDVEAAQERVVEAVRRQEAGRYISCDERKASGVLA